MNKIVLVIGHTLPEPATTAAGTRMMQVLDLFSEHGYTVLFATSAAASEKAINLSNFGIKTKKITLNDSSFDGFVSKLNPQIVLFDRFITEEQFGWRVAEQCPKAIRILDTEDLHFLRKARQLAIQHSLAVDDAELHTEMTKREIASIYRCDLSLIISEVEKEILEKTFNVPSQLLYYLPFLMDAISEEERKQLPSFNERKHFITIGNLHHAPNVDAVLQLKKHIWPHIRKQLPEAKLLVFGAYAPQQILELHKEADGFIIQGWAPDSATVMRSAKVCLAPIRFGAGLKGKLIDAMRYGLPSVTTAIGVEGICGGLPFSGYIEEDYKAFAAHAVQLYQNEHSWNEFQQQGFLLLEKRFLIASFSDSFRERVENLLQNIETQRKSNFVGQILLHQSNQASKYMSKWIEAKNREQ